YSSDQTLNKFFQFPKLKLSLRRSDSKSIEAIKQNSLKELTTIPEIELQERCEDWKNNWCKCLASNKDDFQTDQTDITEQTNNSYFI
ncbi:hypothetical protein WH47_12455, partial [Habropoda laboriosa]